MAKSNTRITADKDEVALYTYEYTATSGQTAFSGSDDNSATLDYTAGSITVSYGGLELPESDYTATNGTSIVLADGAVAGEIIRVVAYEPFVVSDALPITGGTLTGALDVTGTVTADGLTVDASSVGMITLNHSIPSSVVTIGQDSTGDFRVRNDGVNRLKSIANGDFELYEDTGTTAKFFWDASAERLGIGTTSPLQALHVNSGTGNSAAIFESTDTTSQIWLKDSASSSTYQTGIACYGDTLLLNNGGERMRIDSSGNVLVGKTAYTSVSTNGVTLASDGAAYASTSSQATLSLNRNTTDGSILDFYKNGTTVGSIGTYAGDRITVGNGDTNLAFVATIDAIIPASTTASRDNAIDLGHSSVRFDDVYATNGTIQTSDRNEKQDIASLNSTEMNVAKRISAMFKKFRWIDSVTEKGANARTHSGVIAQDVQQAFTDEGLDAGDYSLFISTTWWETQTQVPAVDAVAEVLDDDGNVVTEAVEAKDAHTVTNTFDTLEEAPDGATERTRMGIRYPQLLSFLAAYNEQRFTDIEARLTALEAV